MGFGLIPFSFIASFLVPSRVHHTIGSAPHLQSVFLGLYPTLLFVNLPILDSLTRLLLSSHIPFLVFSVSSCPGTIAAQLRSSLPTYTHTNACLSF